VQSRQPNGKSHGKSSQKEKREEDERIKKPNSPGWGWEERAAAGEPRGITLRGRGEKKVCKGHWGRNAINSVYGVREERGRTTLVLGEFSAFVLLTEGCTVEKSGAGEISGPYGVYRVRGEDMRV